MRGLSLSVAIDKGSQCVHRELEKYLEDCGIDHRKTTQLWSGPSKWWGGERTKQVSSKRMTVGDQNSQIPSGIQTIYEECHHR